MRRQAKTVHDSAEASRNKYDLESGNLKKATESNSLERLLMLAKPEKYLLLIGTIALVFANIATLVIPALFGQLINLIGQDKSVADAEGGAAEVRQGALLFRARLVCAP